MRTARRPRSLAIASAHVAAPRTSPQLREEETTMRISFANTQHVDALIKCCMMVWLSASRMSAQSEPAATPVGRPLRALPAQRTAAVLSLKSGDAPIAHPPLLGENKRPCLRSYPM
jgi:hypothetical protein